MSAVRVAQRTCLGCRETIPQESLLRLVCSPAGEIVPDLLHKLPGRGAYLCYNPACVDVAVNKNQFQRAFRRTLVEVDSALLKQRIVEQLEGQLQGLVALLRKAGCVQAGASQIQERLGREEFALLVLAEDISQGRAEKLQAKARACRVDYVNFATKTDLGHWVGKGESSALGLVPGGLTERFKQAFARYRQLSGEL